LPKAKPLSDTDRCQYPHLRARELIRSARSRARLARQKLNASARVGLPWPSLLAFLRLITNPRVFEHPEPMRDAWQQVPNWLASDAAWIPQPTERHTDVLCEFLALSGVHGSLVPDAHLAALAVEHGLTAFAADKCLRGARRGEHMLFDAKRESINHSLTIALPR
jgi:predicted nucleic acid-binding protein